MPKHIQPLIKTPQLNLGRWMQHWLSAYPNGYAKRNRRSGPLSRQVDWVAYDEHHRYWTGLHSGNDPASAYRKLVAQGQTNRSGTKLERLRDWVYGDDA